MLRHLSVVALILAAAACAIAQEAPVINHLTVVPVLHERSSDWHVQVRFTTSVPAVCHLEAGPAADELTATDPEPEALRNHRFDIPGERNASRFVRVVAVADGGETASDVVEVAPPPDFPRGDVARVEVPLTVAETAGVARTEPVIFGIPLPEGALGRPDSVRLSDGDRELLPIDRTVLVRWPDRTIKWLLLSTNVALLAGETKTLTLELGTEVQPSIPMIAPPVRDDGDTLDVSRGATALRITRSTGEGTIASADGEITPLPISRLIANDGTVFTGRVEHVEVEEEGLHRAVVLVRGHHTNEAGERYFGFEMRYFLHAGDPFVRVDHILQHDIVSAEMEYGDEMKSFRSLDLVFPAADNRATVMLEDGATGSLSSGQRLFQHEDNAYEMADSEGTRAPGVATMGGLTVAVRDFWQNWPKAFAVEDGSLAVGLYPAVTPSDRYAERPNEQVLYYYLRDGSYTFRSGFEKRHELLIGPAGAAAPEQLLARMNEPLLVTAPPEWYIGSGAVHQIAEVEGAEFPAYDETLSECVDNHVEIRERDRYYGLMNFGDWWGERGNNWGNIEYDLQHACLAQYFRTGDRRFFALAEEAARHNADVDIVHSAAGQVAGPGGPRRVGQAWVHSMGHTGGYYPYDYIGMSIYSQGYCENEGHMWSQGNFEYWLLTGDEQVRRAALQLSDWLAGPDTINFDYGNARVPGWMGILTMSAWFATHDPYYLNAMHLIYEPVQELGDPEAGLWVHKLSPGHCDCEEPHYGEAGFMAGVMMTALKYYYLATGDPEIAERIVKIANWCVESLYDPAQDNFRYTSCPNTSVAVSSPMIMANGMAFAANYSGDEALMELVRRTFTRAFVAFAGSANGKSFAYATCSAPMAINEISKFTGPTLAELSDQLLEVARDPGRQRLPSIVPNPDFELGLDGWRSRTGGRITLSTDVAHSGRASAMVEGTLEGQNEYFVTYYECGPPWEIMALQPGERYRMQLWLRVDELTDGAPAPNARLATRVKGRTQATFATNFYDLARRGEWQLLETEFTVPPETDAAYIAVNTVTTDPRTVRMFLDDIAIVPATAPRKETYVRAMAEAEDAEASGGVSLVPEGIMDGWQVFATPEGVAGSAAFTLDLPLEDDYTLLLRAKATADGAGQLQVRLDGEAIGAAQVAGDGWSWIRVGAAHLHAGPHTVTVGFPAGAELMLHSVLLTNE